MIDNDQNITTTYVTEAHALRTVGGHRRSHTGAISAGAGTGKTVQFDVYKPDKTKDLVQSGVGAEVGATGRYHKSFDVDAPGWFVEINDNVGGKAVKHIDKDKYDAHGISGSISAVILAVADVQTAVNAAASAINDVNTLVGIVDGKVDAANTNITALATAIAVLDGKIDLLGNPPMVG